MKYSTEEVYEYLTMWRDDEAYTDLNLFLEKGYLDLAIRLLVNSGAIDPSHCDKDAKVIEQQIIKMNSAIKAKTRIKELNEALSEVEVWVNSRNEHYFIDKGMHFVTDKELISYGFTKKGTL